MCSLSFPFFLFFMAFQSKSSQRAQNANLNAGGAGAATPQSDALTSQLPVRCYGGQRFAPMPPAMCPLLVNSQAVGYFTSPGAYVGAAQKTMNPLTINAMPPTGAPGAGASEGTLKSPMALGKKQAAVRAGKTGTPYSTKRKGTRGGSALKKEAIEAKQLATSRAATSVSYLGRGAKRTVRSRAPKKKLMRRGKVPSRLLLDPRTNRRPYQPASLGGGSVLRLPKAPSVGKDK